MRIFIQANKDYVPANNIFYHAYQEYKKMGYEIILFHTPEELKQSKKGDIVLGYIDTENQKSTDSNITMNDIDDSDKLKKNLIRKNWKTKIHQLNKHPKLCSIFMDFFVEIVVNILMCYV